jgi:hypothetical protein
VCADSLRCLPPVTRGLRGITHERVSVAGRAWVANGREKGAVVAASALKIGVSEMASTEYEYSTGSRLTTDTEILPAGSQIVCCRVVAADEKASQAETGVSFD